MSWIDALKKNDKEFEKKTINTAKIEIPVEINNDLKDSEEEFEFSFSTTITDIKIYFKNYIEDNALPFLDNRSFNDYNFYDFIKYNSENFAKLCKKIEKENEEYENEIDEDEQFENNLDNEQNYK